MTKTVFDRGGSGYTVSTLSSSTLSWTILVDGMRMSEQIDFSHFFAKGKKTAVAMSMKARSDGRTYAPKYSCAAPGINR
jgi:hypothetical protein